MFERFLDFVKYNNFAMVIFVAIFLFGGGVFASTETGQEVIGGRETVIEGVDNTLLLAMELDRFNMDFTIEKIMEDEKYYYVTYTFLDVVLSSNVWQYQLQEKIRKVSKKLRKDLGLYLEEELREEYQMRVKDIAREIEGAKDVGEELRTEVVSYDGLIGESLSLVGKVFRGYEPVKVRVVPTPELIALFSLPVASSSLAIMSDDDGGPDDLTDVYNDYVEKNDPDGDDVFGVLDNCPTVANPDQEDGDDDGLGDVCDPSFTEVSEGWFDGVASSSDDSLVGDDGMASSTDDNLNGEVASSSDLSFTEVSEGGVSGEDLEEEQDVEIVEIVPVIPGGPEVPEVPEVVNSFPENEDDLGETEPEPEPEVVEEEAVVDEVVE